MTQKITIKLGDHDLILETGRMAKQTNGSVYAEYAGSAVLATVCCASEPTEDLDFVPLSVEYNEKYYAAGKIPGGFLKREARPKDKEILVSRLIDRPIRPLFHKSFARQIQLVPTVISTDQVNPPDMVAMMAAFTAVAISDIPFEGPVSAVRIGRVDDEFIVNPTFEQIENGQLDIIVAGTSEGITMVEGGADEVSEDLLLEAIAYAEPVLKELCELQLKLVEKAGKAKLPLVEPNPPLPIEDEVRSFASPIIKKAAFVEGKHERHEALKQAKTTVTEKFAEQIEEEQHKQFSALLGSIEKSIIRASILQNKKRTDQRSPEDIRNITCEIDVLPRTHGSALFTRGETQALAVTTLGSVYDEQIMDNIDGDTRLNFMLHYNFPPFSVGETGRLSTGRREIGHGHLAHRALGRMLPPDEKFPYTIRIVSEVLESNGSSSMATVCGGSQALMNAGVPLKRPVAGIAMGLISEGSDYVVLSDILGEEDHLGDMDFKVAGTTEGITAFQMDIKIAGVSTEIMKQALSQAQKGRMHILGIMNETINSDNASMSQYAPRIEVMKIDVDKIGMVIGPGGKNIKNIAETTDSKLNIEDDGTLTIYSKEKESLDKAKEMVDEITAEPEIGAIYDATVKKIMDFGAFVEILPGKEGLCHISKMSHERVEKVTDVMKEGDVVPVKLIDIDRNKRLVLSHIAAIDEKSDTESK